MLCRRYVCAFALAVLAEFTPGTALGAEPSTAELQQARDAFAQAERDERAGDWGTALDKLRRVAQIKMTPGIRFHIALCEEKTGQLSAALEDYARAEKQATDENNREVLAALKEPMEALRARVPRIVLRVPPDVSGIQVSLDGRVLPRGYYNAEIPVDPRTHVVEARAPGRKPFNLSVVVPERDLTTIDVALEPEGVPSAPPTAMRPAAAREAPPAQVDAQKSAAPSRAGAIAATVGAGTFVALGVAAFLVAGGKRDDANAECMQRPKAQGCDDLRAPTRTWDAVALGSWIAGGALAATAIVLWARTGPRAPRSGQLVLGPGFAGLAGSF